MISNESVTELQAGGGARPTVGDAVPSAVAKLVEAAISPRGVGVGRAFAPDAVAAYWDGAGEETEPRSVLRGAEAPLAAIAEKVVGEPRILVCVHDGGDCFVEGSVLLDGEPIASFLANLQLDARSLINRALLYHCPPVEQSTTWDAMRDAPGDAREVLDRYFEHLQEARFRAAAECFSEDCLYLHPPYSSGTPRAMFRGRDELTAGFEMRGRRTWEHKIVSCIQRGTECLLEGAVPGVPGGGSFLSSLSLDREGLIKRYFSVYCSPAIARR